MLWNPSRIETASRAGQDLCLVVDNAIILLYVNLTMITFCGLLAAIVPFVAARMSLPAEEGDGRSRTKARGGVVVVFMAAISLVSVKDRQPEG